MDGVDVILGIFMLCIFLGFCGAIMGLFAAFENQDIRQEFCENEGFEGHEMGNRYHIGYCYNTQGENATRKNFFCKPAPNLLTTMGKCKFLEVET